MGRRRLRKAQGFTLIEVAIVLIIIALASSAVVAGRHLMKQAQLNTVTDDIGSVNQAVQNFRQRYGGMPGDLWDAQTKLGGTAIQGDGDGEIEASNAYGNNEELAFWQHLQLAGLISGNYDGTSNEPGKGVKPGDYTRSGYYVYTTTSGDLMVGFSRYDTASTTPGFSVLRPEEAHSIDQKYDDGNPHTGYIRATEGSDAGANTCTDGTDEYQLGNDDIYCILDIYIEKFGETTAVAKEDATTCPGGAPVNSDPFGTLATTPSLDASLRSCDCPGSMGGDCYEVCRPGGVWEVDPVLSTCEYTCTANPAIANTQFASPSNCTETPPYNTGDTCDLECDASHVSEGGTEPFTYECKNGAWFPQSAGEVEDCVTAVPCDPSDIAAADIDVSSCASPTGHGNSCSTITCAAGYTGVSAGPNYTASCSNGSWSWVGTDATVDCEQQCADTDFGGRTTATGLTDSQQTANITCAAGYSYAGTGSDPWDVTCNDGSWTWPASPNDTAAAVCKQDCPSDPVGDSSTTTCGSVAHGDNCTVSCAANYKDFTNGPNFDATCDDGTWTWSGATPNCEPYCASMDLTADNTDPTSCPDAQDTDTCVVNCATNYVSSGGNDPFTATCDASSAPGSWSWDNAPDCVLNTCTNDPIDELGWSAAILETDAGPWQVGNDYTVRCDSSAWYFGAPVTVTCNAGSPPSWSGGSAPDCVFIDCSGADCSGTGAPAECTDTPANCATKTCGTDPSFYSTPDIGIYTSGSTGFASGTADYGDYVQFACDTCFGYTGSSGNPTGSGALVCDNNQTWSGIDNVCVYSPFVSVSGATDVQISNTTAGYQRIRDGRAATLLSNGNALVVWRDEFADGSGMGIMGKIYDQDATVIVSDFVVPSSSAGDQWDGTADTLSNGNAVVAFASWATAPETDSGVWVQLLDTDGNRIGSQILVNTTLAGDVDTPVVRTFDDGGFVVVWSALNNLDGDGAGIFMQRFDDAGNKLGGETQVNTATTGDQSHPNIEVFANGRFMVTWGDLNTRTAKIRVYEKNGTPVTGEVSRDMDGTLFGAGLEIYTTPSRWDDGNIIVSMVDNTLTGSYIYDDSGTEVDGPLWFTTWGNSLAVDTDRNVHPAWRNDGDASGVRLAVRDNSATETGTFDLNDYTTGYQGNPTALYFGEGRYLVLWRSDGQDGDDLGVYGRFLREPEPFIAVGSIGYSWNGTDWTATLDCSGAPGTTLVGNNTSTCTPSGAGTWSSLGFCAYDCSGEPPQPDGSFQSATSGTNVHGATRDFTCDPCFNYSGAPNSEQYSCNDGSWEGSGPSCSNGAATNPFDLTALDGTNGVGFAGESANEAGNGNYQVAGGGDVNGDGYDDIVIGTSEADNGPGANSGTVYLVFGDAQATWDAIGAPGLFDNGTLDGANGVKFYGTEAGNQLGVVGILGDINGDGYDEIALGEYRWPNGADNFGRVYVVFGASQADWDALSPSGEFDLTTLDGSNGFYMEGTTSTSTLGYEAVRGLGDINGDGFADFGVSNGTSPNYVIFGAAQSTWDALGPSGQFDLTTLDGTNGFAATGTGVRYNLGPAGDVDNDGYDDVLIGAHIHNAGAGANQGSVHLVFGRAQADWTATAGMVDVDTAPDTHHVRISGKSGGDELGWPLPAHSGDVNNDGYDDVIIGAYNANEGGTDKGAVYVIFGQARADWTALTGVFDLTTLDGSNGFMMAGEQDGDNFGRSVNSGGDFNQDGIDDLVVGAQYALDGGSNGPGRLYVIYGKNDWSGTSGSFDVSTLDGSNGWYAEEAANGNKLGRGADIIGDFNGDGVDDLAVNCGFCDAFARADNGIAYVLFGTAATGVPTVQNGDIAFTWDGTDWTATLNCDEGYYANGGTSDICTPGGAGTWGGSLGTCDSGWCPAPVPPAGGYETASSGTINPGDTHTYSADPCFGGGGGPETHTCTAGSWVISGTNVSAASYTSLDLATDLDGTNGVTFLPETIDGLGLGWSVSLVGDMNGDGIGEILLGAFDWGANGAGTTHTYLVYGQANWGGTTFDLSTLDGTNGVRFDTASTWDGLGYSVASAGDVNGDGRDDMLISAHYSNGNAGYVYLVYGQASWGTGTFDLSTLDGTNGVRFEGTGANELLGYSVASAGDIDGDGTPDLLLGANEEDTASKDGSVYLVYGQSNWGAGTFDVTTLDGTNGVKFTTGLTGTQLGMSVAGPGDVDGDGTNDLLMGASYADNGGSNRGVAYLVHGVANWGAGTFDLSTLDGTDGVKINLGTTDWNQFGEKLDGAGDVDGDGKQDVIIATYANAADSNKLYACLVYGKEDWGAGTYDCSTVDGADGVLITGAVASDYGGAVSTAGDVNGDGIPDLMLGAFDAQNGATRPGAGYLLNGQSTWESGSFDLSNLDGANGIAYYGASDDVNAGWGLDGGRDVSGDGTPDMLIGAWKYNGAGTMRGQVYLVFGEHVAGTPQVASGSISYDFDGTDWTATLTCETGYTVTGNDTAVCTPGGAGTWGPALGTCDAVSCSDPEGQYADATSSTVNTNITGTQRSGSVALLNNGNYMIAWVDGNVDDSVIQVKDATGADVGGNVTVDTSVKYSGSIAALANGNAVLVNGAWNRVSGTSEHDIYATIVDPSGAIVNGPFVASNTITADSQHFSDVAGLTGGNFVVVWDDDAADGGSNDVFFQIFTSAGATVGSETVASSTAGSHYYGAVTALNNGNFAVAYRGPVPGDGDGIGVRMFDATGTEAVAEFTANVTTAGSQESPNIATLDDGNIAVTWVGPDSDGEGVFARVFQPDGTPVSGEFQVNTYETGNQGTYDVSNWRLGHDVGSIGNGKFLVVWDSDGQDGSGEGVYGQMYQNDGTALGDEFRVSENTTNNQRIQWSRSAILDLQNGSFVVLYADESSGDYDLKQRIFTDEFYYSGLSTIGAGTNNHGDTRTIACTYGGTDGTIQCNAGTWTETAAPSCNAPSCSDPEGQQTITAEAVVNTNTTGKDHSASVVTLDNGNYMVGWADDDSAFVTVQVKDNTGANVGGEVTIGNYTSDQQVQMVKLSNGNVAVAWVATTPFTDASNGGIVAKVIDDAGAEVVAPFLVNTSTTGWQNWPDITALTGGNFVVSWDDEINNGGNPGAYFQIYQADGTPVGGETEAGVTVGTHRKPSVSALDNGNFVMVWEGDVSGGAANDIGARVFDATGTEVVTEFMVNTSTGGDQENPHVETLDNGNMLVTWVTYDANDVGVWGRIFQPDGTAVTAEFQVNTYETGAQGQHGGSRTAHSAQSLETGKALVTWISNGQDGDGYGVYGQLVANDGTLLGDEFQINTTTAGNQATVWNRKHISVIEPGKYVVVWQGDNPTDDDIFQRIFTEDFYYADTTIGAGTNNDGDTRTVTCDYGGTDGTIQCNAGTWTETAAPSCNTEPQACAAADTLTADGSEFWINSHTASTQNRANIVELTNGNLLTVWHSEAGQDSSGIGVFAKLYDADGNEITTPESGNDGASGNEFQVNDYTVVDQQGVNATALSGGGFMVTWASGNQDSSGEGVYAKIYDATGSEVTPPATGVNGAVGNEIGVNPTTAGDQRRPSIATLSGGNVIVVWEGGGIQGRVYGTDGTALSGEILLQDTADWEISPQITPLANDTFAVAWNEQDGGTDWNVYAQVYEWTGATINPLSAVLSVNDFTANFQGWQTSAARGTNRIATLNNGNWIVVWESSGQDANANGVFAKIFDRDGNEVTTPDAGTGGAVGNEFIVNTDQNNDEMYAFVSAMSDGGFFVSWEDDGIDGNGYGCNGQLFDSAGNKLGSETQMNIDYTAGNQWGCATKALSNGRIMIAYEEATGQDGDGWGVRGGFFTTPSSITNGTASDPTYNAGIDKWERTIACDSGYTLNGSATEQCDQGGPAWTGGGTCDAVEQCEVSYVPATSGIANSTTASDQENSGLIALQNGTFVTLWDDDNGDAMGKGVIQRIFAADGTPVTAEAVVNTTQAGGTSGDQQRPVGTVLADGKYVVVWEDRSSAGNDGDVEGVYMRILNENGTPATGSDILVNTTTAGGQDRMTVVGLDNGNYMVIWDGDVSGGTGADIAARIFDNTGAEVVGEFIVNTDISSTEHYPTAVKLNNGNVFIAWDADNGDIRAKIFTEGGVMVRDEITIDTSAADNTWNLINRGTKRATVLHNDNVVVAWERDNGVDYDATIRIFDQNGDPVTGEITVAQTTAGAEEYTVIETLADGRFIVSWTQGGDVMGRIFNQDGTASTNEFAIASGVGNQINSTVQALQDGRFVVTYDDDQLDGSGMGVIYKIYNSSFLIADGTLSNPTYNDGTGEWESTFTCNSGYTLNGAGTATCDPAVDTWTVTGSCDVIQACEAGYTGGAEIQANVATSGAQESIRLEPLDNGNFIAVYEARSLDSNLKAAAARIFDADGNELVGEFYVNNTETGDQKNPVAALLADGNIAVAWQDDSDGSLEGVFGRVIDQNGGFVSSEFAVNTTTADYQIEPDIVGLNNGKFAVVWGSNLQDSDQEGIYFRIFNADGTASTGEIAANTTGTDDQQEAAIDVLTNGKIVIAWQSNNQDGNNWGIYYRLFNEDGSAFTGELQANTTTSSAQDTSAVEALPDGNFVIAWESRAQAGGDADDIVARIFNGSGNPITAEIDVNTTNTNEQRQPAIAAMDDGRFIVVWDSDDANPNMKIYGQMFNSDGTPNGSEMQVTVDATNQTRWPDVVEITSGKFVVGFQDQGDVTPRDGSSTASIMRIYDGSFYTANGTSSTPTYNSGSGKWESTITCNSGYTLNGSATQQCDPGGATWTGGGTCDPDACIAEPDTPFGSYVSDDGGGSLLGGATREFTCDPCFGYAGTPSSETYTCAGTWSGSGPSCSGSGAALIDTATDMDGSVGVIFTGINADDGVGGYNGDGKRIADVGDVNGDGYDDWVASAVRADPNGSESGQVYLIFGDAQATWTATGGTFDLSTLDGSNGVMINGASSDDWAGYGVSGGGDYNDDGIPDILIGARDSIVAPELDSMYIVFGRTSAWPATIDLGSPDGTSVAKLTKPGVEFGNDVGHIGDFNNDGIDDFIAGTPWNGNGEAMVIFGKSSWAATWDLTSTTLDGTNGFTLQGTNGTFGRLADGVGDINADGIPDLAVAEENGNGNKGVLYVLFGDAGPWGATFDVTTIDGTNGVRINGVTAGDQLTIGASTFGGGGDVNGDGYDDLAVASQSVDLGGTNRGEVYLVFGKNTAWAADLDLGTLDGSNGVTFSGLSDNDQTGTGVGIVQDMNGDGRDELHFASYRSTENGNTAAGAMYVIYGRDNWDASFDLTGVDGTNGFKVIGPGNWKEMGENGSTAGDFNGDGYGDLLIGAYSADYAPCCNAGAVFAIFGTGNTGAPATNNGDVSYSFDGTDWTATLSCESGYNIDGNTTAVCTPGGAGTWSSLGTCEAPNACAVPIVNATSAEFAANTYTALDQENLDIAALANGNLVLGWRSDSQDGDTGGVYTRIFRPDGTAVTGEIQVNTSTTGTQEDMTLLGLANGNWMALWADDTADASGYGVQMRIFGPDGTPVTGEILANSTTNAYQYYPAAAQLTDGNVAVVWISGDAQDGDADGVVFRIFDDAGVAQTAEAVVNVTATANHQRPASVMPLNNGGFVVYYMDDTGLEDGDGKGVYARIYNSSYAPIAADFLVNTDTAGDQTMARWLGVNRPAVLDNDNIVFTWRSNGDIFAKMVTASGTEVTTPLSGLGGASGNEFLVNTTTAGTQSKPMAFALDNGNFIVVWEGDAAPDSDGIYLQEFDSSGNKVNGETLVNDTTAGVQRDPVGVAMTGGGYAIAWEDDTTEGNGLGIFAKIFDSDGVVNASGTTPSWNSGTSKWESTVTCDSGYTMSGSSTWECDAGGTSWSGGTCEPDCTGEPVQPVGTFLSASSGANALGATRTYSCDGCYGMAGTDTVYTCQAGGTWNETTSGSCSNGAAALLDVDPFNGTDGVQVNGIDSNDIITGKNADGRRLGYIGDVNGDGYDDFVASAVAADSDAGEAYLVFGRSQADWTATGGDFNLEDLLTANGGDGSLGVVLTNATAGEFLGYAVNGIGDINDDGLADFAVTETGTSERAFILFGKTSWPAEIDLDTLAGPDGFIFHDSSGQMGQDIGPAGDFNNDGVDDFIVSDINPVVTYVVFGHSGSWDDVIDVSSPPAGFTLDGNDALKIVTTHTASASGYGGFGQHATGIGDVNDDGIADIAITDPNADPSGRNNAGQVWVIFGASSATWTGLGAGGLDVDTLDGTNGFRIDGHNAGDTIGMWSGAIGRGGDVNADGLDDFTFGSVQYPGGTGNGAGYILFGRSTAWPASIDLATYLDGANGFRVEGASAGDYMGRGAMVADDLNGDGISDLIYGARGPDVVYVVYGKAGSWPSSLNVSTLDGTNGYAMDEGGNFSENLVYAGDVNGDGYGDLAVGEPYLDANAKSQNGSVWLVFGFDTTGGAPVRANGSVSDSYAAGDWTRTLTCDSGYTLSGSATDTCTPGGATWTGGLGTCDPAVVAQCQSPISAGTEYQGNVTSLGEQKDPAIVNIGSGQYAVIWSSMNFDGAGHGIAMRLFEDDQTPLTGEIQVNATAANDQNYPAATLLSDGNIAITWASNMQDGSSWGVYTRVFDNAGSPVTGEVLVPNSTGGNQLYPDIQALSGGNYIVTWTDQNSLDGSADGIYGRVFNNSAVAQGASVQLNSTTANAQKMSAITELSDNNVAVVWWDQGQGIITRVFDTSLSAVSSEVIVNTGGDGNSTKWQPEERSKKRITALQGGGFAITWNSYHGTGQDIYLRLFDNTGTATTAETIVNTTTTDEQTNSSIATMTDGRLMVAWESNNQDGSGTGVYAQIFLDNGTADGSEFLVNNVTSNNQGDPVMAGLSNGDTMFVWESVGQDGDNLGIIARPFSSSFSVSGSLVGAPVYNSGTGKWESTIVCKSGYTLNGSATQTCDAGGASWSGGGTCEPPQDWVCVGWGNKLSLSTDNTASFALQTTGLAAGAYLDDVVYADGLWVAVSEDDGSANGSIITSPDGVTWTERFNDPNTAFYEVRHNRLAGSAGLFIATGWENGRFATSPDGINWTLRHPAAATAFQYWGIDHNRQCGGDGLWVMTGDGGDVITSPNGVSWTARTSNLTTRLFSAAHNHLSGGAGLWMIGGQNGEYATSPDGITWTARTFPVSRSVMALTYANGNWIAGDSWGQVWYSADAINWTAGSWLNGTSFHFGFNEVGGADSLILTAEAGGVIHKSTDNGVNWTPITDAHGTSDLSSCQPKIETEITCSIAPASPSQPADPANGSYSTATWSGTQWESTLTCNSGYTADGPTTATAPEGGSWSNTSSCVADCSPVKPADPSNGSYAAASWSGSQWESTLTCDSGYTASGSTTADCAAGGSSWNNTSTCDASCNSCPITDAAWETGNGTFSTPCYRSGYTPPDGVHSSSFTLQAGDYIILERDTGTVEYYEDLSLVATIDSGNPGPNTYGPYGSDKSITFMENSGGSNHRVHITVNSGNGCWADTLDCSPCDSTACTGKGGVSGSCYQNGSMCECMCADFSLEFCTP